MKRKYDTLNEEIYRIKSLFTEERLFGNLIKEGVMENVTDEDTCTSNGGSWDGTNKCKFTGHADYPDEGSCTGDGGVWDEATSSCTFTVSVANTPTYQDSSVELSNEIKQEIKDREGDHIDFYKGDGVEVIGPRKSDEEIFALVDEEPDPTEPQTEMKILKNDGTLTDDVYYLTITAPTAGVKDRGTQKMDDKMLKSKFGTKFEECRKNLTDWAKDSKKMSLEKKFGDSADEAKKYIEFCLSNYWSKLEKTGFLRKGNLIDDMKTKWEIETVEKPGGTIGMKYQIKYKGRLYGHVKKVGENEYRIISKKGEKIFGNDKKWRDKYVKYAVRKAINLSDDQKIDVNNRIIQKGPIQWAKFTIIGA